MICVSIQAYTFHLVVTFFGLFNVEQCLSFSLSFMTLAFWKSTGHFGGVPLSWVFLTVFSWLDSDLHLWQEFYVTNVGSWWTFKMSFPDVCGFPVFYFLAFGETVASFSFLSCVYHGVGVGGQVWGVCVARTREGIVAACSEGSPETEQEESQSRGNSRLFNWPLTSANCWRSPNRLTQSRGGCDEIWGKRGQVPSLRLPFVPKLLS